MPSMTITTSAQDASNLADAVGWKLGLGGPATLAQVKQYTIDQLMVAWRQYSRYVREQQVAATPVADITPA